MAYVVTAACLWCREKSCVGVCPVECFYEDEQTWIDPDECIDCAACEPECPAAAIRYTADERDPDLVENRRRTSRPGQRPILPTDPPAQLPEAEHRVARDALLVEIARAAAAAGREDLPREAEAWFPATPSREGRAKPPDLATQQALFALLKESYPDRWPALVRRGHSLLASVRRAWTEGE